MYRNTITYNVQGSTARHENTVHRDRERQLSTLGAQRILRKEGKVSAIVSRVESVKYE